MGISKIDKVVRAISMILDQFDGGASQGGPGGGLPSGGAPSTPSASRSSGGKGGGEFNAGPNEKLGQWKKGIDDASDISGLDPNLIGGMVWAESRGDKTTSTTNKDGNQDTGLMQISQERWNNEIVGDLDPQQRQKIVEKTGKQPEDLDMSNPEHSIIGGSLEMKKKIKECDGDVDAALQYYQSGDKNGNPVYAKNVMQYMDELANGEQLSEDPHGSP